MPRALKPPRLYLMRRQDRPATWVILDRGQQQWLGLSEKQRDLAESDLRDYINGCFVYRGPPEPEKPALWALPIRGRAGVVYFATCDIPQMPDFPIKIGFSIKMSTRLSSLQTGMPWPLIILATTEGTLESERRLHATYSHLRLDGEWFRRGDDLMAGIAELANGKANETRESNVNEQCRPEAEKHALAQNSSLAVS